MTIRPSTAVLLLAGVLTTQAGAQTLPPEGTGLLYVSGFTSNNIAELTPQGVLQRTLTAPGMAQPRGIATDALGNLVVVCQGSARILVLDLAGNVLQTVTHPDLTSGTGIARSPQGDWYVGNFSPGRVVVFDATWSHLTTLTTPGMNGVNCVAFDPSGTFAVTAALANRVFLFDSAGTPAGFVDHPMLGSPMSIALDSQGNHYVSNGNSGVVIKFDPAWSPLFVFGAGTLAAPQGIAVDEHDRLLITNYSSSLVHRYSTQGQVLGSFTLAGATTGRNLTYQTSALVLARLGAVGAGSGFPQPILTAAGSAGDAMGRVAIPAAQPFALQIAAAPQGPTPSPLVLYLRAGEPGLADVTELPSGLGLFAFPVPLTGGAAFTLVNSFGFDPVFGTGLLPPVTAPGTIVSFPSGLGMTATLTLQGLVLDNAAPAAPALPASTTNALVLTFF